MKRTIVSAVCGTALLVALMPVGVMAAKNPAKAQLKESVKSGKLTRQEAKQLKSGLKAFRAEVKAAKANGKINPEEKARLKAERDRLRNEINTKTGK